LSLPSATSSTTPTDIPTSTATPAQAEPTPTLVPPFGSADQIALLSGNDIYLMNPDGTGLTLVRTDNAAKSHLHWIPNGLLIYVSRNCAYMLDSGTRRTQEIVCFPANELLEDFHVSSDGKYVAISVQRTLNILPFDLDRLKNVTTRFNLIDMQENCYYNQYPFREILWSKDNKQLATRVIDTNLVISDQIFLVNVDIPNCDTVGLVRLDKIPGSRIDFEKDSTNRIASYDWDGKNKFLLNDSIRNDGFGDLYLYDSETRESVKLNPINGACCYRDARWSPDGRYILFAYQGANSSSIELYYVSIDELQNGAEITPVELPPAFFSTPRDRPQPALRPAS
jgi:Tol biopolymer transport system component